MTTIKIRITVNKLYIYKKFCVRRIANREYSRKSLQSIFSTRIKLMYLQPILTKPSWSRQYSLPRNEFAFTELISAFLHAGGPAWITTRVRLRKRDFARRTKMARIIDEPLIVIIALTAALCEWRVSNLASARRNDSRRTHPAYRTRQATTIRRGFVCLVVGCASPDSREIIR